MVDPYNEPLDETGPPDGVMCHAGADIEDAAAIAIRRAKDLYEQVMGHGETAERIMNLRRLTEKHREELWRYDRTMYEIRFVLNETIRYLQKASDRMEGLQQKMERLELPNRPSEVTKSPPGRAQ
jgi:hypothetical protein